MENFLATADYDPATLTARDKIVGKAAALLMIRLGIRAVRAGVMSKLGRQALEKYNVKYAHDTLVDRIDCRTEEILVNEFDLETAYAILKQRANR